MTSQITQKLISQFKKEGLSLEDRNAILTAMLSRLVVLPLNDSIIIGQNNIKINGKDLDMEQMISFRESCVALKDNSARKILHEQVRYLATNLGVYKAVSLDEMYFAKAALWCLAEEDKFLDQVV